MQSGVLVRGPTVIGERLDGCWAEGVFWVDMPNKVFSRVAPPGRLSRAIHHAYNQRWRRLAGCRRLPRRFRAQQRQSKKEKHHVAMVPGGEIAKIMLMHVHDRHCMFECVISASASFCDRRSASTFIFVVKVEVAN